MRRIFSRRRRHAGRFIAILVLAAGGLFATAVLTGVLLRSKDRIQVLDAGTLRIDGARVRLFGIDAPGPVQTCRNAEGAVYACGRRAAAFMKKVIGGSPVTCARHRPGTTAVCYADGSDIASALVRAGWALHESGTFIYLADERNAQAAGRGMWSGTFTRPSRWRQQNATALSGRSG